MHRLTDDELLALLNDTESDRAERKETFKGDVPKKARQAVCAFANDLPDHNKPGVLFIGASDAGEPSHFNITDQLLLSLADNRPAVDITIRPKHQTTTPYPQVALQQVLYNAVLHRTYESTNAPIRVYWFNDRIEINSPGGPYGNVTVANFGDPGVTDYRNPNIADVLKTFGFIQAFGRGIATARRAMLTNGNPALEFTITQTAVVCTLRGRA